MQSPSPPIPAIGYLRVSTDQQANDGVSLAAQRAKLEMYAQLYGYHLVAIIEDAGASAKTLNRPGLTQALERMEAGEATTLIVAKLDRLTRSVADLATLIEDYFTKFSLVSVGEQIDTSNAAGRLVLNVLMSVAQWEREAIGERTKTALQHKKAQGQRVGGIPYGSQLAADGVTLEPNAAEREVIAAVLELHTAGLSLRKVAAQLEARGFTSRTGKAFSAETINSILKAAA